MIVALTAAISGQVSVPVIASGGAKLPEDFANYFYGRTGGTRRCALRSFMMACNRFEN